MNVWCFNEAGAASPRKWLRQKSGPQWASMRPGQLRPGNMTSRQIILDRAWRCFNEAGAASPRK